MLLWSLWVYYPGHLDLSLFYKVDTDCDTGYSSRCTFLIDTDFTQSLLMKCLLLMLGSKTHCYVQSMQAKMVLVIIYFV